MGICRECVKSCMDVKVYFVGEVKRFCRRGQERGRVQCVDRGAWKVVEHVVDNIFKIKI